MLATFPRERRDAVLQFMHEHKLTAEDPMVLGPVLSFMVNEPLQLWLEFFQTQATPDAIRRGYSLITTFTSVARLANEWAVIGSLVGLVLCGAAGYAVHLFDSRNEHQRVCYAAGRFERSAIAYADKAGAVQAIAALHKAADNDCNGSV